MNPANIQRSQSLGTLTGSSESSRFEDEEQHQQQLNLEVVRDAVGEVAGKLDLFFSHFNKNVQEQIRQLYADHEKRFAELAEFEQLKAQAQSDKFAALDKKIEQLLKQQHQNAAQIKQLKMENKTDIEKMTNAIDILQNHFKCEFASVGRKIALLGDNMFKLSSAFSAHQNDKYLHLPRMHFVNLPNKWDKTDKVCCEKECCQKKIGKNVVAGCGGRNGGVCLDGAKAEYIVGKKGNHCISVFAKSAFSRNFAAHSGTRRRNETFLFYFEVTIKMGEMRGNIKWFNKVGLSSKRYSYHVDMDGDFECLKKTLGISNCAAAGSSSTFPSEQSRRKYKRLFPRLVVDGDVVGCGMLLFRESEKGPKFFFTLNGETYGKVFSMGDEEYIHGEFFPFVQLDECSVEANFGEAEFCFDIHGSSILEKAEEVQQEEVEAEYEKGEFDGDE